MESLKKLIKAEADNLGFSFIAFSEVKQTPHFENFRQWVENGFYGSMSYLSRESTLKARQDPASLLENARSMLVFGVQYNLLDNTLTPYEGEEQRRDQPRGIIASYATYEDYHPVLKRKVQDLIDNIGKQISQPFNYRIFIDSAPVMEKDNAFMAGAGWIGKNSLLISPKFGSSLILGCILTDLKMPASQPFSQDLCGNCRKCVDSCPTGCIMDDHSINAAECISYLTIEYKGIVPQELRSKIGSRIFGCDICQNVCPINRSLKIKAQDRQSILNQVVEGEVDLLEEIRIDEKTFKEKYGETPVPRATYEGFRRNLIIALGNSRSPRAVPIFGEILQNDASWLLRLHSAWALSEINTPESKELIREHLASEEDDRVRAEIIELME